MSDEDFSDYQQLSRDQVLPPIGFQGLSFNVVDQAKFRQGLVLIKESLRPRCRTRSFAPTI